ncbi:MAG: C-terminal four region of protein-O-mannosyltransferase [Patescibacteria group bacterium]|nr:C-terminal four region of protein-O-mannosyltransferase [Patescibacteria group bacterium]
MNPKRWHPELIVLILAAALTRVWNLFSPNAVVFDETYFKSFAAHYLNGHYYFDIHPPLGKLMLAGLAHLQGLAPSAMISGTAVTLRWLPAVAGILLVPLVWGILRRLGATRAFAFLGAALILLDNALTVESRFILMDSTLLLCGLGALYLYLRARTAGPNHRWLWLGLAALSAGAAISIKWTGLTALALIGLLWLWDQPSREAASWPRRLGELAVLAFIPTLVYLSVFWAHFQLLPRSGDGDAFMTPQFQSTLIGNAGYDPHTHLPFITKFIQLNQEMYRANQTLTATHPYGSRWYTWPLEGRPIYYWQGDTRAGGRQGNIYLLGNPAVWWGVWIAILAGLVYAYLGRRRLRPATMAALAVAATAYFLNFLPFVAVARVMFLYHYFFSFIFSLIFAVMLWNDLATTKKGRQLIHLRQRQIYGAVIVLITLGFIFFAPLTYGSPLTPNGLQARMWLHSWR